MFAERRKKFLASMDRYGVAVLVNPGEITRSHDTNYKYRSDTDFYYLTGFNEPDSVAVFIPEHPEHQYVLFVRPKDPERETWDGRRAGVEGSVKDFGADIAFSINDLEEKLPELLKNKESIYYSLGIYADFDLTIINTLADLRRRVRSGDFAPEKIIDTGSIVHEMRLFKSSEEVELMRQSNVIAKEAHTAAMKMAKEGVYEYEVESVIENIFRRNGAVAPAYNSIVGTGINATILHYTENNTALKDGDLLLIDAGAEYQMYASDITRTFPVSGKFTKEQKEVYEIVLEANLEAIKEAKPGNKFIDIHNRALRVLTEGMVKLGFLKGDVDTLIKEKQYEKFYMHRTGHWLGMDVHDRGKYHINGESRTLEPGMVLTVEPGFYIQEGIDGIDPKYIGIGIRIEDDILITADGNENLSSGLAKTVEEIEALMSK
jgi:Xaa-Pro aminopeptidase